MLSSYIHESKSPNISYRAQHDGIAWRYTGSMPLRHAKYDTQKSSRSGNGNDGVPQRWYEQPRERSIRGRAAPKTTTPVHPCTAHKYSMQRSTSFPRCQTREQCGISSGRDRTAAEAAHQDRVNLPGLDFAPLSLSAKAGLRKTWELSYPRKLFLSHQTFARKRDVINTRCCKRFFAHTTCLCRYTREDFAWKRLSYMDRVV
jgi:hypothetical protein